MTASAEADTQLVSGTIKWFNSAKGFGFVVPDGGGEDILLHVSVLKAGKYDKELNFSGAPITVRVTKAPRGFQCVKIESLVQDGLPYLPRREFVVPISSEKFGPELMEVKWFNRREGFGFFERPKGPDIFVHMELLRSCRISALLPGQKAQVTYGENRDRKHQLIATHVKLVS